MRNLRRSFVALVFSACLLPACLKDRPVGPPRIALETPAGYRISFLDQGVISSGRLTVDELAGEFDQAVAEAAEYLHRYGTPVDEVLKLARRIRFSLVDDCWYRTAWSPTGYAAGVANIEAELVTACVWRFNHDDQAAPAEAPSWTCHDSPWWTGWKVWGSLPLFLVVAHELGHFLWGPDFEHGWTPPVVVVRAGQGRFRSRDWHLECGVVREGS